MPELSLVATGPRGSLRRYLIILLISLLAPALLLAAFVIGIDPYYVFGAPSIPGVNAVRPFYEPHVIIAKPYQMRRIRPQAVALGSSRVEVGLDPHHPAWGTTSVFNFAMPSSTSYDTMLAFLHAQAVGRPLKTAVLGLDFFAYNLFMMRNRDQNEERFAGDGVAAFADFLDVELKNRPRHGSKDRSQDNVWNEKLYLAVNGDVAQAVARKEFASGRDHYEKAGRVEGRLGASIPAAWSEATYMLANPDVAYFTSLGNFLSGYHHYLVAGRAEGRPGATISPNWDEAGYMQANPDVAYFTSLGNFYSGLHHYTVAGRAEGRIGGIVPPNWNEAAYLAANPSARIHISLGDTHSGYVHYAALGRKAGRNGGFPPENSVDLLLRRWPSLNNIRSQLVDAWQLVFSITAVEEAAMTLTKQSEPHAFNDVGVRIWKGHDASIVRAGGTGHVFRTTLLAGKWDLWLDQPRRMFCFTNDETGMTAFDPYRFMLRRAYAAKIDMRLYTTPLHAAVRQLLIDLGLGSRYDFWLKALTSINEEEAARAARTPYPLWDFSLPNTVTQESIPPSGDSTVMHGYWDFSHYRSAVGDLILDRIFDYRDPARTLSDDFGVKLRAATIDQHIARSHTAIAAWDDTGGLKATIAYITKMPVVLNNQAQAPCW